jgi:hypothetical protein
VRFRSQSDFSDTFKQTNLVIPAAMKIIVPLANLLTFASLSHAFAFTSCGKVTRTPVAALYASADSSDNSIFSQRRQFLTSSILLLSSASAAAFGAVSPALADVSDGNELPQAAAQFRRVLRAKSDLVVSASFSLRVE